MTLRTAHGAGRAAGLRSERRPVDEVPALNADDTAKGLADAQRRGRPFEPGNSAAAGRKPALASGSSIPMNASDPDYKKALGWSKRFRAKRIRELKVQHGGWLSSGVEAMVTSLSLDLASARYLSIRGAQTGSTDDMLAASRLGQSARQLELTICDLAEREGAVSKGGSKGGMQITVTYAPDDPEPTTDNEAPQHPLDLEQPVDD